MTLQWTLAGARRRHSNSLADIEAGLGCSKARQQIIYRGTHRRELLPDHNDAQLRTITDFDNLRLEGIRVIRGYSSQ